MIENGIKEDATARIFKLHYGSYEDPKSFEPYHLLLLALDLIFNWIIDWAHTDPLAILVIFVFQCLGLIVNLIVYIMASASQAMQSGLRKSLVYHHELNLLTCVTYIILTCCWYIWALRKSWPSVSDQFSFSFSSGSAYPHQNSTVETTPPDKNDLALTTISTTLSPLINTIVTQSVNRTWFLNARRLLQDKVLVEGTLAPGGGGGKYREFYTLWSPGFVALYTVQRTVAIIHYFVSLKATFLVLNASTIDKLEEGSKYSKRITRSLGDDVEKNTTTDTEPDEGGRRWNFGNNSQIGWDKKIPLDIFSSPAAVEVDNQGSNLSLGVRREEDASDKNKKRQTDR